MNKISIHKHAVERLKKRFDLDESWLLQKLENEKFVWVKGAGNNGNIKKVRSGYLIYISNMDRYCLVIVDDYSRLAISVLTESMAKKSSWSKGIDESTKLKAKRATLGCEVISDCNFLRLYAEERGKLLVNIRVRTFSYDWESILLTAIKTNIIADQIDLEKMICTLTEFQMKEVSMVLNDKVLEKKIRPYYELFISTGSGKTASISNEISEIHSLESADQYRRWRT